MKIQKNCISNENIIYLGLWALLFAIPLFSAYMRSLSEPSQAIQWQAVFQAWQKLSVYAVVFALHNFLLAPLLVFKQKRTLYLGFTAAIIVVFQFYECISRPYRYGHGDTPEIMIPPPVENRTDGRQVLFHTVKTAKDMSPHGQNGMDKNPHPPVIFGEPDIIAGIILVLMLGMNIGIKLYFKSRQDRSKLDRMEKKSLEQQLEYLKYQINPHFFMNTLNNIHALVDIDPEKAKSSIIELSKLMRFVLYKGADKTIPLNYEFDFINHYVALMRMRYANDVSICLNLPAQPPERSIPPLLLIPFIENAFKHGVSYNRKSFIEVSITIEGERLKFACINSKNMPESRSDGGVGLTNVKQRLRLIYENNFTLHINDTQNTYSVEMNIPLNKTNKTTD